MGLVNLEMKQIRVDTAGAKNRALQVIKDALGEVAEQLAEIIKREIARNGNGSTAMKDDAISLVQAILKESNYERVIYESGIDPGAFASCANDFRVRVLVVLHGNMASGPIVTKPGQMTFAKGVVGPRLSPLTEQPGFSGPNPRVVHLDFFEQDNDIAGDVEDNAYKQIEAAFNDVQQRIMAELADPSFWTPFLRIG